MRSICCATSVLLASVLLVFPQPSARGDGCRNKETSWITLFDGQSLKGWKVIGCEAAVENDLIVVCGSLFTVGEARAILLSERFEPCRG